MMDIVRDILYILITGCGVAVAKYLVGLINKQIDKTQVDTDIKNNEKLNQYVDSAQQVISNVVLTMNQTMVDSLKNSGKFDKAAQEEAKNKAIEMAKQLISEESKNAIIILYNDFDVYLNAALESAVNANKTTPEKQEIETKIIK